ncbi:unnamed protein product [Closterium sp. Naga37s-1]|nr:unnamed protein product [Closterium sp. Naga37s-1]
MPRRYHDLATGADSGAVDAAVASPTGGVITAGSVASAAADAESSVGDEQRHWHRKLMGSVSRGRALQIIAADFINLVGGGKKASDALTAPSPRVSSAAGSPARRRSAHAMRSALISSCSAGAVHREPMAAKRSTQ